MPNDTQCLDCSINIDKSLFTDYPDCLTVMQLQKILGIGKNTAYKLLETGQIKHRRLGRKYLIPKVYVVEYLLEMI